MVWTWGFNWKGIDFSALLQGQAGIKDVYLSALYKSTVRQGYQLNADIIEGRWYEGRTDAKYPRLLDYSDTRKSNILILGGKQSLSENTKYYVGI